MNKAVKKLSPSLPGLGIRQTGGVCSVEHEECSDSLAATIIPPANVALEKICLDIVV